MNNPIESFLAGLVMGSAIWWASIFSFGVMSIPVIIACGALMLWQDKRMNDQLN